MRHTDIEAEYREDPARDPKTPRTKPLVDAVSAALQRRRELASALRRVTRLDAPDVADENAEARLAANVARSKRHTDKLALRRRNRPKQVVLERRDDGGYDYKETRKYRDFSMLG